VPSIAQSCNHVKPSRDPPGSVSQRLSVYAHTTQRFRGSEHERRGFEVRRGRVLYRWLGDRKGRSLSHDDVTRDGKIVLALEETILLMGEIDRVNPWWPTGSEDLGDL
jgi:hypothetical protein